MKIPQSGLHGAHLMKDLMRSRGERDVRSDLASGHFTHFSKRVLVERSRAADLLTRAAAAILTAGPDAVLTSHTAVRIYGCEAADQAPVHLVLPYKHRIRSRPEMVVHHSAWEPRQVETLYDLPV